MGTIEDFYVRHLEELDKKLNEIYTTTVEGKSTNVLKELTRLVDMQNVYSVIESEGTPQGDVFEKYKGYLVKVRERLLVINKKIDEIEQENSHDIKNIELLKESFTKELNSLTK